MDLPILIRIAVVTCVLLAGCEKHSALYCEKHPTDQVNCPPVDASGAACASDPQCTAPTPRCELGTHVCVECLDPADCTDPTAPVCGTSHACHGCTNHSECASLACLPTGACEVESNVAYVTTGGNDGGLCTRVDPCQTITAALATNRPVVKIMGGGTFTENLSISSDVTIVGEPSVKLTESNGSPEAQISGTANVALADFEIAGAGGSTACVTLANTAVLTLARMKIDSCTGAGVSTSGGTLVVSRSTLTNNAGGGIKIASGGGFDITNTFIVKNGNNTSGTTGGATLNCGVGTCRFELNTVVENQSRSGTSAGISCDFAFAAPNNIIAHNRLGTSTGTEADTTPSGACTYPDSAILTDTATLNFVSATDYHIAAGSVAIDQALTASTITVDRDGDHRPQGPAKDQGADELK
jgi:hypothetical protein